MSNIILLKAWNCDEKTIALLIENDALIAKIYTASGEEISTVPAYDMDIPSNIRKDPALVALYIHDSAVHLAPRTNGSFGLYITPRLRGGGKLDLFFSFVQTGVGIALLTCTGPVGMIVGAGCIAGGIKGGIAAHKNKENWTNEYWMKNAAGFSGGVIIGSAIHSVSNLNSQSNTVQTLLKVANSTDVLKIGSETAVNVVKGATFAVAGAASQIAHDVIIEKKIDGIKTLANAVLTAPLAAFAAPKVIIGVANAIKLARNVECEQIENEKNVQCARANRAEAKVSEQTAIITGHEEALAQIEVSQQSHSQELIESKNHELELEALSVLLTKQRNDALKLAALASNKNGLFSPKPPIVTATNHELNNSVTHTSP